MNAAIDPARTTATTAKQRRPAAVASAVAQAIARLPEKLGCPTDGRYLVGVSGGRDSMVLLDALVRAGFRRLVVCHLNHLLRGRAAQADARLVAKRAAAWKLTVEVGRADVRALAETRKLSIETAAREARRSFFFEVARRRRCWTLLLAHQADDQVETVLFNLCRGGGATGLAGMLPVVTWPTPAGGKRAAPGVGMRVVRPLLGVWRNEVDAYAREHGIVFREDRTNTDPAHMRNRLRHEILPALDDVFGRDVSRSVWRAADLIGAEEEWMRASLRLREEDAVTSLALPYKEVADASVAEQRRLLRAWLRARGAHGISYDEIERTRTLLDPSTGPAKINLPGGGCVRRRAGVLFVEPA